MAKDWAKTFYNSKAWEICREGYVKSVHGLCERCGAPGKIVHHKVYLTPDNINDPNVSLNWDNLEYLCQDCHNKEHFEKYSPVREGLMFDENGNLVLVDSPPFQKLNGLSGRPMRGPKFFCAIKFQGPLP